MNQNWSLLCWCKDGHGGKSVQGRLQLHQDRGLVSTPEDSQPCNVDFPRNFSLGTDERCQEQRSQSRAAVTPPRARSCPSQSAYLNPRPNIWKRAGNPRTSMDELSQVLTSGPKTNCWDKPLRIWAGKCQQSRIRKAHGSLFTDSNGLQNLALKRLRFKGNVDNR